MLSWLLKALTLIIAGNPDVNGYDDDLVDFIKINVLRKDQDTFLLSSNEWDQKLKRLFDSDIKSSKISYNHRLNKDKFKKHRSWREMIPNGYTMVEFDGSSDEFLEKHGKTRDFWNPESKRFGRVLIKDDIEKVVSECFSFCFYNDNVVELGIETEEAYRSRGFAYLTSAAFIEHCISINIKPNWHCHNVDIHSKALAEKLGFEEINNTYVFIL